MGYRISYGRKRRRWGMWWTGGLCAGAALWCAVQLGPVWQGISAGDGLYDALARFVGGLIRAH